MIPNMPAMIKFIICGSKKAKQQENTQHITGVLASRRIGISILYELTLRVYKIAKIMSLKILAMAEENDRLIFEKKSMPVESIFDILIDEQISFGYYAYPVLSGYTSMVLKESLKIIKEKRRFFTFQFSEPDNEVHYVGSESSERRRIMSEVDLAVEKIYNQAISLYDRVALVLVGDHGMVDVHKRIDAGKIIHSLARLLFSEIFGTVLPVRICPGMRDILMVGS